ncbi:transcription factor bHLH112-like protein [Gossypium australe]|uniref:Transcription factor bHLH112-like protein n=1 Tax=Gossypium australe TaxID=47621 RepID=A0A5B6WZ06_9ROSI|nr:transcription factor bHLH112-like protein [Gossypium australe]
MERFFWFMTKRNSLELIIFYSEIEKTARKNRREPSASPTHRTMFDYAKPTLIRVQLSIVRPTIATNNFKLKPNKFRWYSSMFCLMGYKMKI